jgi:hypothetical protein
VKPLLDAIDGMRADIQKLTAAIEQQNRDNAWDRGRLAPGFERK